MTGSSPLIRRRVVVRGLVQGVGFRPFVYGLARRLSLAGWAANTPEGLTAEVEGPASAVALFLERLEHTPPPHALIRQTVCEPCPPQGAARFELRQSRVGGAPAPFILPDIATCDDCLRELFDPDDRRYRYPFISCTHCGPRFSIITDLPYDRERTTMARFRLCSACRSEYDDPGNRRFHAQTNACPDCGPSLRLLETDGRVAARHDAALAAAVERIGQGAIVALKGIGGFQLIAAIDNHAAIARLRQAKARPEQPFAVMLAGLEHARQLCRVGPLERTLLTSLAAPIVLLRRQDATSAIASNVAPDNGWLGVMLPCSPLHHLLLAGFDRGIVATSGNRGSEPICIDDAEALERLADIVDCFLTHDRPIARPADDSVTRVVAQREMVLRRARGDAPLPIDRGRTGRALLAVGGQLKNTVAIATGDQIVVSPHIGRLDTLQATDRFRTTIAELQRLYRVEPDRIAHDLHPDYHSTRFALADGRPTVAVQHHYAHVLACMAEHGLSAPVLGIAWDGIGLGPDRMLWGGEFLRIEPNGFDRIACWRPFPLPGAEQAVREPRRAALGLLSELYGSAAFERTDLAPVASFSESERRVLRTALERGLNAPRCASVGRLFDAVASLTGLCQTASFEGQAAIRLEQGAERSDVDQLYPLRLDTRHPGPVMIDWEPSIAALLADLAAAIAMPIIATTFHNTLVDAIARIAERSGLETVVLSGGCFQNRLLCEHAIERLRRNGHRPFWPQRLPPNDGGLALGQIVAADIAQSKA